MSSLLMLTANGNRDWVGLPVFTVRRYFHTWSWIRIDRGIDKPEDLRGARGRICHIIKRCQRVAIPNTVEFVRLIRGHMRAFGLTEEEVHHVSSVNPEKIMTM